MALSRAEIAESFFEGDASPVASLGLGLNQKSRDLTMTSIRATIDKVGSIRERELLVEIDRGSDIGDASS